jgi:hypothetical protein
MKAGEEVNCGPLKCTIQVCNGETTVRIAELNADIEIRDVSNERQEYLYMM